MSAQGKGNLVVIETTVRQVIVERERHLSWVWQLQGREVYNPASNRVNEVCGTVLLLDRQAPAMGSLKTFLLAASGLTEDQIIAQHAAANKCTPDVGKAWEWFAGTTCGGAGEALTGQYVVARATEIKKKNGEPFTKVVWAAPDAEMLAALAA